VGGVAEETKEESLLETSWCMAAGEIQSSLLATFDCM
jgi:hypothetical protein